MDYLEAAKTEWMRVPGFDGGPEHFMAAAQTMALIDIAESLRKIARRPIIIVASDALDLASDELREQLNHWFDGGPVVPEPHPGADA